MIDSYTISRAYPGIHSDRYGEIEILSDKLIYTELQNTHSGCQVNNMDNQEEIHKKCREISKLIKEIDKLNQSLTEREK